MNLWGVRIGKSKLDKFAGVMSCSLEGPDLVHGTNGIFTYMNGLNVMANLGKYASPMDPFHGN